MHYLVILLLLALGGCSDAYIYNLKNKKPSYEDTYSPYKYDPMYPFKGLAEIKPKGDIE